MCLYTRKFKNADDLTEEEMLKKVTKIAKEDILVYKVFKKGMVSPHRNHSWSKNGVEIVDEFSYALSAYGDALDISGGLHAYTTKAATNGNNYGNQVVVEMVIPKGTAYIVSTAYQEIVALCMRVHNKLKPKPLKTK